MKNNQIIPALHEASAGLMSGVAAGIVLGIGARMAMRMVAFAVHFQPSASVEGSLGVVVIGVLIGAVAGVIFAPLRHHFPVSGWCGPLYGLAVMALLAPILLPRLGDEVVILTTPAQVVVAIGSFGFAFYIYGLVLQWLLACIEPRLKVRVAGPIIALFGVLAFSLLPAGVRAADATDANETGGLFVNQDRNTTSAGLQIDGEGGLHLVYVSDPQGEAFYSYCAASANCLASNQWSRTTLGHNVMEAQLALTPAGKPRLLLLIQDDDPATSGMNDTWWYAACDAGCTTTAGWQLLFLGGVSDVDTTIFETSNHYFALDAAGNPRVIFGPKSDFDPDTFEVYDYSVYASCDHDCLATAGIDPQSGKAIPANWSFARVRGFFRQPALALTQAGQPRLAAFAPAEDGSGGDELIYLACDQGCEESDHWLSAAIARPDAGHHSVVLRLNSHDQPRLALFAQNSHSTYLWCNAACNEPSAWGTALIDATTGDSGDPDLQLDRHDHPRIAYQWREEPTTGAGNMGLGYAWCDAGCESPQAHFERRFVESSSRLDTDWALPRPSHCVFGQWLSAYRPSLALDAQGNPHIAYDADFVVGSCLGQPGTTVITHKGVRYDLFTQGSAPDPAGDGSYSLFMPALAE